jgi:hypothetical protein
MCPLCILSFEDTPKVLISSAFNAITHFAHSPMRHDEIDKHIRINKYTFIYTIEATILGHQGFDFEI